MKHKVEIPNEVWAMIFCYLCFTDLIEVSAACKRFYRVIHIMPYYVKKLDELKKLFTSRYFFLEAYENIFKRFYDGVKWNVLDIVCMNKLDKLNHEHLWFCCRSHYCNRDTCGMCSSVWLENVIGRSALGSIKIKNEEFFPPFQHHDKPFGHLILSVGVTSI